MIVDPSVARPVAGGSMGSATVNFDRNFRALSKGADFHSIARG